MTRPSPALASFQAAAEVLAKQAEEPAWLAAARADGWQEFAKQGIPGGGNERWKYTRLAAFERQAYALPGHGGSLSKAPHSGSFEALGGPRLVFVDGCFDAHSSTLEHVHGLRVVNLARAIAENDDVARELLGNIAQSEMHPFAALNSALLSNGALIDVDADARISQPVYLLLISSAAQTALISNPRILLRVGANAALTVVEHHVAHDGARNFVNVAAEGRLEDGARLEYYCVHDGAAGDCHLGALHLEQARNSHAVHNSVSLGGRMVRYDLHSRLLGSGASIDMRGLYMAGDRQHVDNHTLVEHCAPHTSSQQDYKGVLHGRGRAVFNGKVLIHEGATGSVAHQVNNNLLLSDQAEVDTKPELEIYNDDVKCSHGATVGQLDKEALFYLRSRGIGEKTARTMLTFAFAEAVIQGVSIATVRERIEQTVIDLLPDSDRIRSFT